MKMGTIQNSGAKFDIRLPKLNSILSWKTICPNHVIRRTSNGEVVEK